MTEKRYLKWYNKVGYGSGDIAGNVVYAFLSSFVMIYLTNTVGLNPGIVGTLIAVSKLLDGVTDIFFGSLIDKTHSKMGKARPWMLYGYIGCAITLVAIFAIPTNLGQFAQYAWFLIAYTLLNAVFYTANNIAYSALTALVTKNSAEQVEMGSWRFMFAFATSLLIQSITLGAVTALGGGAAGWRTVAIIYAIIGLLVNTLSVFSVKELPEGELVDTTDKKEIEQDEKYNLVQAAKLLAGNKYYMMICVTYILQQIYGAMISMGTYYATYNIGVRGENFDVLFSDLNGGLTSYRYAGKEMIQEIPRPNFWRAPTDNDCGNNMGGVRGQWKLASLYATAKGIGKEIPSVHGGTILQNPTCEVEADSVVVTYLYNLQTSPAAECSLQYRVFGDGRIQTTLHYDPVEGLAAMPEFGVLFKIDADYDTVEWYGNGPAETYWDRQHGAKLGIYQNKVADNMAQYLVPQECGAKTAVRWAKVVDRKGRGLLFTADAAKPMFFSALPYTPHEMESAKHPYELPPVHYTVIRAIGEQMGVGGDDSWGANVHPEYIPDVTKPVEFTFTFRGI